MKHGEKTQMYVKHILRGLLKFTYTPAKVDYSKLCVSYEYQYECSKQGCEIVTRLPL